MSEAGPRPYVCSPPTRLDNRISESCPYCDRPFRTPARLWMHVAECHPDVASTNELERAQAARDDEGDALFIYHLKVVAALVALYTVFVLAYMVYLGT